MNTKAEGAPGAARRAQIEATLADYPNLGPERLEDLLTWFRKEASALDVAMVASNPAIAEPYARFRAEHIDAFSAKDAMRITLVAVAVGIVILMIAWQSL